MQAEYHLYPLPYTVTKTDVRKIDVPEGLPFFATINPKSQTLQGALHSRIPQCEIENPHIAPLCTIPAQTDSAPALVSASQINHIDVLAPDISTALTPYIKTIDPYGLLISLQHPTQITSRCHDTSTVTNLLQGQYHAKLPAECTIQFTNDEFGTKTISGHKSIHPQPFFPPSSLIPRLLSFATGSNNKTPDFPWDEWVSDLFYLWWPVLPIFAAVLLLGLGLFKYCTHTPTPQTTGQKKRPRYAHAHYVLRPRSP
jgi:hypothetical protein